MGTEYLRDFLKTLLCTFYMLTVSALSLAQITISGQIIEEGSGESLPNAAVTIHGTAKGTTTNLDGYFSLFDIPESATAIEVSYVGYKNRLIEISSMEFSSGFVVIGLQPQTEQLEELVISANAYKVLNANSGISMSTISTKQLALLPSVGETDIFRSLQLLPGVSGTNENSSGLFVRGGTPDQNLVLLDGMTVYKVDHFFGFFSAFNANAIKDVQLYKGAFPAKYGGRTSSVVNMTGKSGSTEKIRGGANFNLLSVNGFIEVPLGEKLSFLAAGRRSYTDILRSGLYSAISDNLIANNEFEQVEELDGTTVNIVEPDFYFYDWNSKLTYRPSDRDILTLSFYNGQDYLDESQNLERRIDAQQGNEIFVMVDLDKETSWGNTGASTKWSRQWNSRLYSNFLLASSRYFSEYDRDGFLDVSIPNQDSTIFAGGRQTFEDNLVKDLTFQSDFEWQVSANDKLSFGMSFTNTDIDYSNIRDDTVTLLARKQVANYGSIYLSDEKQIGDRLSVTAGVRLSKYENEEDLLFEPRLNATYDVHQNIKLKAAYGRHYQFVNRIINESISEGSRDFWLLADGDLVEVSSATHYIGGVSYERDNWLFDVEGYYKNLKGLSEFTLRFRRGLDIEVDELFFTGDGVAKGVEFLLQKKQGNYTGWGSYTLGQVRHTFPGFNDGLKFPALHDQRHEFKMVHSVEIDGWNLSATFVYGSGKPFSEPEGQYSIELLDGRTFNYVGIGAKNGSRLPPYHRLDLAAHYRFPWGEKVNGDIGLSFFNFYNRKNIWYIQYDFTQEPVLVSEILYLGMTPNFTFSITF